MTLRIILNSLYKYFFFNKILLKKERQARLFPYLAKWYPKGITHDAKSLNERIRQYGDTAKDAFMGRRVHDTTKLTPAGYTYFGQFIAHELTFSLNRFRPDQQEKKYTSKSRLIPRLRLDTLYGNGPLLDPFFFDQNKYFGRTHFKVSSQWVIVLENLVTECYQVFDLNRQEDDSGNFSIPLIPDSRNDDNIVVSQLHVAFQLAHNQLMDQYIEQSEDAEILQAFVNTRTGLNTSIFQHDLPKRHGHHLKPTVPLSVLYNDLRTEKQNAARLVNRQKLLDEIKNNSATPDIYLKTEKSTVDQAIFSHYQPIDENNIESFLSTYWLERPLSDDVFDFDKRGIESDIEEPLDKVVVEVIRSLKKKMNLVQEAIIDLLDEYFKKVKEQLQWNFQWLVLHEFLPQVVKRRTLELIFQPNGEYQDRVNRKCFLWEEEPYLPIEFSAAFFRFGHSMVHKAYAFNKEMTGDSIFKPKQVNARLRTVLEWKRFFPDELQTSFNTSGLIDPFIDLSMIKDLGIIDGTSKNIVYRNLERSRISNLPAGQDIAREMVKEGLLTLDMLESHSSRSQRKKEMIDILAENFPEMEKNSDSIASGQRAKKDHVKKICEHSPLWLYILMEAHLCSGGERLGPVAGRIVAEVLIGLVEGDDHSFWHHRRKWKKLLWTEEFKNNCKQARDIKDKNKPLFNSMKELLKYVGVYEPRPISTFS